MADEAWSRLVDAAVEDPALAERLVREDPALLEQPGPCGETPLHFLAIEGFLDGVRTLLRLGAGVDPRNRFGDTPLLDVALLGEVEAIRLLLDAGADVRATTTDGANALHHACSNGNLAAVALLVERGLRMDERDETGTAPQDLLDGPRG